MIAKRTFQTLAGLVLAATFTNGCGGSSYNPVAPSNQPTFSRSVDNFTFAATDFSASTQTLTYSLTTTVGVLEVIHAGTITSGQATLTLIDNTGTQVYSRDLRTVGTFATSSGAAGTWEIQVRLTDVTGSFNFSIRK